MSAPHYVPADPVAKVRSYSSPPRRPGSWLADRPGEIRGLQPEGERLGAHGPDGGYALKLARRFEDSLQLHDREDPADVLAGGAAVAMKRAASFGRAPISEDLEVGLVVWGFLDANVDPELVELDLGLPAGPTLELFLVCPRGLRQVPRVDAVFRALEEHLPQLERAARPATPTPRSRGQARSPR